MLPHPIGVTAHLMLGLWYATLQEQADFVLANFSAWVQHHASLFCWTSEQVGQTKQISRTVGASGHCCAPLTAVRWINGCHRVHFSQESALPSGEKKRFAWAVSSIKAPEQGNLTS